MEDTYCYLKEGPTGLLESCDILLRLDDGSDLPLHLQVLVRCSQLFNGMLDEGVFSGATAGKMISLPFSNCSQEEATSFLTVTYSLQLHKHDYRGFALSAARLADKLGVKDVVEMCDDALSGLSGKDKNSASMSSYLEDQSPDAFIHILDRAVLFDMPKLLSCCEYHICVDPHQRFHPVQARVQHEIPISSALQIAEGLHTAFQRVAADVAPATSRCPHCTFRRSRFSKIEDRIKLPEGTCTSTECAHAMLSQYVSGSMEFLEMAQL